jgi:hypothetical protein
LKLTLSPSGGHIAGEAIVLDEPEPNEPARRDAAAANPADVRATEQSAEGDTALQGALAPADVPGR